jgi:hypothetical protein
MSFLSLPTDLPPDARRTFRYHLAYALLDAACGGVLLTIPFVAFQALKAPNWQQPMRDVCVGFGMLVSLYLGSQMATRRKKPFVIVPVLVASLCSLAVAVALTLESSFLVLLLLGVGGMFEIVTRPAVATILRTNYPVTERGRLTATVRQWSSLCFMLANLLAATLLNQSSDSLTAASIACACISVFGLLAVYCFRQIPDCEHREPSETTFRFDFAGNIRKAFHIIASDGRYQRYLFSCFLEGFFLAMALSLLAPFLKGTLELNYLWCAALKDSIPTAVAVLTTGWLGGWFDRTNPWIAWATVRLAYGVDALLLAVTPLAAIFVPPLVYVIPVTARLIRGSVQGGWWVLLWQIGITHFAPPGEDTSRYAGIMVFLNGVIKIVASTTGMVMASYEFQPQTLLCIGGIGILASSFYSLLQARRDRREHRPATFAEFESCYAQAAPAKTEVCSSEV